MNLTTSDELIITKSNVLVIYHQKTYKNLLNLNSLIIFLYVDAYKHFPFNHIKHGTHNYQ